ncbi:hypothetical protein UAW_03001, partial [Enterococcus haemoperoxidus ATCC BAA-382]
MSPGQTQNLELEIKSSSSETGFNIYDQENEVKEDSTAKKNDVQIKNVFSVV